MRRTIRESNLDPRGVTLEDWVGGVLLALEHVVLLVVATLFGGV